MDPVDAERLTNMVLDIAPKAGGAAFQTMINYIMSRIPEADPGDRMIVIAGTSAYMMWKLKAVTDQIEKVRPDIAQLVDQFEQVFGDCWTDDFNRFAAKSRAKFGIEIDEL